MKDKNTGKLEGVMSKGYGIIPKLIMKDKDLSIEAKSIYAYLVSYTGSGTTAYPSVSLMCSDLGISKDRFYRHRKKLVEKGYIKIEQHQNETGWSNNVYTITSFALPYFTDTRNTDTQNTDTQNKDTNKNSSNNNSINKNNKNKEPSSKKIYGEFKNVQLTDKHISLLKHHFPNDYKDRIERLSSYMESKGKTDYKNHYAVIRNWAKNDKPKQESTKDWRALIK